MVLVIWRGVAPAEVKDGSGVAASSEETQVCEQASLLRQRLHQSASVGHEETMDIQNVLE